MSKFLDISRCGVISPQEEYNLININSIISISWGEGVIEIWYQDAFGVWAKEDGYTPTVINIAGDIDNFKKLARVVDLEGFINE